MYLEQAALPLLIQDRNEEGVSFTWSEQQLGSLKIPIQVTHGGISRIHEVPTNGDRYALPADAIVQVDPQLKIFRDFATTEACTVD